MGVFAVSRYPSGKNCQKYEDSDCEGTEGIVDSTPGLTPKTVIDVDIARNRKQEMSWQLPWHRLPPD